MPDSAYFYLALAEPLYQQLENKYAQASLAHLYWQIEKTAGNYIKAMEYLETYHQYKDELTNREERNLLMELQKKYNTTALENEYNREKSLLWKITAFLGCGILLLLRAFFYYQKENEKEKMALEIENKMEKMALEIENKKEIIALEIENKKERMALENENKKERMALKIENKKERMALENENKKEKMALEKMERDKEETEKELIASNILRSRREKELKAAIIDKLDVVKKMAEFGRKIENKTELTHTMLISMANELIEKYTMEKIMESTNELYPNLDSLLENRAQEEKLTEREKCVCHLIACGFDNDDIALFIDRKKSTKTVENWKTTIRKKLGIPSYGDMYKILTEANT